MTDQLDTAAIRGQIDSMGQSADRFEAYLMGTSRALCDEVDRLRAEIERLDRAALAQKGG